MCSYFAANGVSACGDGWLLNAVLRGTGDPARGGTGWNRTDAVVMSDCGAVGNMLDNGFASGPVDASAKAINGGLDLYGGEADQLWADGFLLAAVQQNATRAATVRRAARRTLLHKLKLGLFDPINGTAADSADSADSAGGRGGTGGGGSGGGGEGEGDGGGGGGGGGGGENNKWVALGRDGTNLNSSWAQQVSYEAALQAAVLLKHDGAALPLRRGAKLAVVGPLALEQAGLFSDYVTPTSVPGCGYACMETIGAALAAANAAHGAGAGARTAVELGVDVSSNRTSGIGAALAAAAAADVVVLALGITHALEHEGVDRADLSLPGLQEPFAQQVLALGKPTVLVLCNGGSLSIDGLVAGPSAIVEAFNPAIMGPRALAALLYGDENRWGKLPVTVYPAVYAAQIAVADMTFTAEANGVGRGYRYYRGVPLFKFGHGLSLTSFSLACAPKGRRRLVAGRASTGGGGAGGGVFGISCTVTNTGAVAGDEVVQVYHSIDAASAAKLRHPVPKRKLVDFERVSLAAGASAVVDFAVPAARLTLTTNSGTRVVYPSTVAQHTLTCTRGHGNEVPIVVTVE